VTTNLEFLRVIAADPRYAAGDTTTKFVEGVDYAPRAGEPACRRSSIAVPVPCTGAVTGTPVRL
jgi:acetyl/propionyl-CoA carboxylase alpha subunit